MKGNHFLRCAGILRFSFMNPALVLLWIFAAAFMLPACRSHKEAYSSLSTCSGQASESSVVAAESVSAAFSLLSSLSIDSIVFAWPSAMELSVPDSLPLLSQYRESRVGYGDLKKPPAAPSVKIYGLSGSEAISKSSASDLSRSISQSSAEGSSLQKESSENSSTSPGVSPLAGILPLFLIIALAGAFCFLFRLKRP